jgi:FlaA1/EpsC-like NDP-sugar epimerase
MDEYDGLTRQERRFLSLSKFVFSGFTAITTTYVLYFALEVGITRQFLGGFMTAFMLVLITQVLFSRPVLRWVTRQRKWTLRGRLGEKP